MQPIRRRPAHHVPVEKDNRAILLMVTACSKDRKRIFTKTSAAEAVLCAWESHLAWQVGRYVFMPDHIHFFCTPGDIPVPSLTAWMKAWKSAVSRKWPEPANQPIWQIGFWDRQLRDEEHYGRRWEYVRQNPVRAGLCNGPDKWPWQGELNILEW